MTEQYRRRVWILAAFTVVVLCIAYGPLLVEFFANQWARPHYQYFPFVLGAFVWLLWQRLRLARPRDEWLEAGGWGLGAGSRQSCQEPRVEGLEPELGSVPHLATASPRPEGEGSRAAEGRKAANRYDIVVALIAAWLLLGLAYVVQSPWPAYASACLVITGCFVQLARHWQIPYLWGIWLLPWLVLPLPLERDQRLIATLQRVSSQISSIVLDRFSVPHLMEGNTLILPDKKFFVDEACSGIVSVMSIIACAVIYGVWRNRAPLHLSLLTIAGIGWATFMNVLRISLIAIAYQWYGVDWSKGTPHEVLGLAVFLCTFLALVSTDYAIVVLTAPIKDRYIEQYGDPQQYGRLLVNAWDWLHGWGQPLAAAGVAGVTNEQSGLQVESGTYSTVKPAEAQPRAPLNHGYKKEVVPTSTTGVIQSADVPQESFGARTGFRFAMVLTAVFGIVPLVAFGALAGAQFVLPRFIDVQRAKSRESVEQALTLCATSLPNSFSGVSQTGFTMQERAASDVFGQYSRIYEYKDNQGNIYLVSCDFLFPDWHNLVDCYRGIGWHVSSSASQTRFTQNDDKVDGWRIDEAVLAKPDGTSAYLLFSFFDGNGDRPTFTVADELIRTIRNRTVSSALLFQVQVWTIAAGTVNEEQKQIARNLFLDVRERFREQVGDR